MNRILVIDKRKDLFEKLETTISSWKSLEARIEHTYVLGTISSEFNYIIIDCDAITDMNTFITANKTDKRIIVVVDYMNENISNQYICNEIQVVFRNFGISALIYKLFGVTERVNIKAIETRKENEAKDKKIVAIMSPSGGTGKSTLAFSMAYLVAQKNKKALFIDLSTIGSAEVLLDKGIQKNGFTNFFGELHGKTDIDPRGVQELFEKSITVYEDKTCKFDMLYGTSPIKMEAVDEHDIDNLILALRELDYDFIVIDTSSELSRRNFTLIEACDEVIIMAQTDIGSGWKSIQYRELLDYIQVTHKCSFVINRYNKYYGFSCSELESELQIKLIGILPERKQLTYYCNKGEIGTFLCKDPMRKYLKGVIQRIYPIFDKKEIKIKKAYL